MPGLMRASDDSTNWIFNLRDHGYDSESDEESPNDGKQPSSDSQLLKTLDLSSREDKAMYKPNPWAIAKLNAACRASASKSSILMPVKQKQKKSVYSKVKQTIFQNVSSKQVQQASPVLKKPTVEITTQKASNMQGLASSHSTLRSSNSNKRKQNSTLLTHISTGTLQDSQNDTREISAANAQTPTVMKSYTDDLPCDTVLTTAIDSAETMVFDETSDSILPIYPAKTISPQTTVKAIAIVNVPSSPDTDYMLSNTAFPHTVTCQKNMNDTSMGGRSTASVFNTPIRSSSSYNCPSLKHIKGSCSPRNMFSFNATHQPANLESPTTGIKPVIFSNEGSYTLSPVYRSSSSHTDNEEFLSVMQPVSDGGRDHEIPVARDHPVANKPTYSSPISPDRPFRNSVTCAPSQKRKRGVVSAYASLRDPDEDLWSTLLPCKKVKVTPSKIKTSAKFILPISMPEGRSEYLGRKRNVPLYRPPLAGSKTETENQAILQIRRVRPQDVKYLLLGIKQSESHAAASNNSDEAVERQSMK